MKAEKQFKKHILDNINPDDYYNQIASKIEFNEAPKKESIFMKRKGIILASSCVCLAIIIGGGSYLALRNRNNVEDPYAASMVTMDVNPSVKFVLDQNNKVMSASGQNDEGKMIVADEELVGKDISEAINIVINVETETGFLVSGNVSADENTISFTFAVDDEKAKANLEATITAAANEACEKLNIQKTIETAKSYSMEALRDMAKYADSTLTDAQLANMSYTDLLAVINLYSLETASLYSVELEQLYNQAKEYEIKLADKSYTKEAISELGALYSLYLSGYDALITSLNTAIDYLNQVRYNNFVASDCAYQQTLNSFMSAKQEYIQYRNEIAQLENADVRYEHVLAVLEAKIEALDAVTDTLEQCKDASLAVIDVAIAQIDNAIVALDSYVKSLPDQAAVENKLAESATALDQKLNDAKNGYFKKFEDKYGEDIANMKQDVADYKNDLKQTVAAAKEEANKKAEESSSEAVSE